MGTALRLALVGVLILANGYFVAVEFSLVAADRNRIDAEAEAGGRRVRLAAGVLSRLSFHLSGAQLGITVTSLLLGFLAEPAVAGALEPALEPLLGERTHGPSIALALVLATVFQMIVGELIPKSLALARAHRTVILVAPLVRMYGIVAGPLVRALNGLANSTLRRFGIEPREELATTRTLDELMIVISAAADEGELDTEARQLLERSIRFGEKTAADVIVPRHAVEALHDHDTVADLVAATARTGFSRFPVMGRNLDDIVGTVHVRRVFEVDPTAREATPLASLVEDAFVVPESRDLDHLLVEMAASGRQLAIVVDEYGGTAGILTVEDVLESIVGAIDDEHDHRRAPEVGRRAGCYEIAGSIHVDEMPEACGLTLPEGEYETLAGFLLDRFGHIPAVGEAVEYKHWRLEVAELDRLRISQVVVTPPPPASEDPDGEGPT
jgi:CBS domain containing-hemolysin-like protein